MKEEIKDIIVPIVKGKGNVKKVDPKHIQEQELLFTKADLISPINKKIDPIEIVKTIGGQEINLNEYIEVNYINYTGQDTHFTREQFYYPLADMFGVDRKLMDNFIRPHFVPVFKNNFIISRFPQKVVSHIREKNKYIAYCRRGFFHYQLMTKKADSDYRLYIGQVQAIINRNPQPTLKEFIIEYCTEYHLAIQLDMFDSVLY